jgi:cellulose biosynthesis protein BcsE
VSNTKEPKKLIQFGIEGLSQPLASLSSGSLYALDFEFVHSRFQILVECLRFNIIQNISCTLITAVPVLELKSRFETHHAPELIDALESGHLGLLTMHGDYTKNVFLYGADRFVQELEWLNVKPESLLIIDQADHLFTTQDSSLASKQSIIYQKWVKEHKATIILCFLNRPESNYPSSYRAMMDYFSGSMRIMGHGAEQLLCVDFWSGPEGAIAGLCTGFGITPKGRLHITHAQFSQENKAPVAPPRRGWFSFITTQPPTETSDENNVLFIGENIISLIPRVGTHLENAPSSDSGRLQMVPTNLSSRWKQAKSFGELLEMAKTVKYASIIIDYTPETSLTELTERVYVLRNAILPTVKIAIREDGTTLRYHGTALLLRLGVNTVFTCAMPRNRLPILIESMRGQVYKPTLHMSIDEAIRHAQPITVHGFMQLQTFIDEVIILLERAVALSIPSLFIIFQEESLERNARLIKALQLARKGDLISVTDKRVLLFLFSCGHLDLEKVMRRILPTALNPPIHRDFVLDSALEIQHYLKELNVEYIAPTQDDLEQVIAPKLVHNSNKDLADNILAQRVAMETAEIPSPQPHVLSIFPQKPLFNGAHSAKALQKRDTETCLKTLVLRLHERRHTEL